MCNDYTLHFNVIRSPDNLMLFLNLQACSCYVLKINLMFHFCPPQGKTMYKCCLIAFFFLTVQTENQLQWGKNNRQLPFSTDEVPQFITYFTLILQGRVNVDWSCQIFPVMHCNSKKNLLFDKQ